MNAFDFVRARLAVLVIGGVAMVSAMAGTNVVVWDTMKGGAQENWKRVPSDLMQLEKDPLKSASDPGYYGRDYSFSGDVVVENAKVRAYFLRSGRVTVTTPDFGLQRLPLDPINESTTQDSSAVCFGQIAPATAKKVKEFELIRNAGDGAALRVDFGEGDSVTYTLGKNEIIEVKPAGSIKRVRVVYSRQYVIAPAFVGDDLIFNSDDVVKDDLPIPAENILIGLGHRGRSEFVITWPGHHSVAFAKKDAGGIYVETSGDPFFVAAITAPGIWHAEKLDAKFLEKDVTIGWKPPFMARWQTQLMEGSGKTTYAFRHQKGEVWRGVAGSYIYPVWFEGDKANFSLSKKVPPKGEAVIYFLEGQDTPPGVLTPVDVLKETLGRPAAEAILDVEGRKLRTHHGSSGSGVHRACTCGYTEAMQAVFEKGEECDRKEFVDESIRDMIYFVRTHLARIDEYRAFAKSLTEYLQATAKSNPELKDYLDDLEQTVQQIPAEYENQEENMKSLEYAAELQKQTMALTGKKEPDNLKRYMELLKAWRGMGGAQDFVVAQYHIVARRVFQDAGYNAAALGTEKAIGVAEEIRKRTKEILRNPDGYEIWANY